MKPNFPRLLLVAAAVAALPLASHAQVISVSPGGGATQIHAASPVGQSFTAIAPDLTSFDFYVDTFNPGFGYTDLTLSILNGAGTGGSLVESQSFSPVAGSSGWAGVTFSDPATLVTGNVYTAVISDSNPYWGVSVGSQPSTYTGGEAFFGGSPQYQPYYHDYSQLAFQATFGGGGSSVPDAANTAVLFGLGLVGLAAYRGRKSLFGVN